MKKKIQNQKWGVENKYYIPEEIVDIILLKLSVKDVIKCSAVCKSWNSLVKNPTFIRTHLNNQTAGGDSGLLLLISNQSNDLHWDNPAAFFGHYSKLLHPIHDHNSMNIDWTKDMHSRVVGTCNGLVCLAVFSSRIDPWPPVILWNPSIRKFGFLPCPPSRAVKYRWNVSYNFCYDSRIDDYKVVRIVKEFKPYSKVEVEVEVWSLATGTWKTLSNVPAYFSLDLVDGCCNNFVNGAFHWVQKMEEYFVVALDMVDESFRNVKIPQDIVGEDSDAPTISRYHGDGDQLWLTLFAIQEDTCFGASFDVWVMKEYGVVESWTKLLNVCLLGSPEEKNFYYILPFGLTKSGQVVVEMERDEELETVKSFKCYDPEDKQLRDFGNQGYKYYFMDSFVESLVLLGQFTNVFYY